MHDLASNRNVTVASPIWGCGRRRCPGLPQHGGPKWSKKMEWAHHASPGMGEGTPDRKASEIDAAWHDHELDWRRMAGASRLGVLCGKEAHP